MIRPTPVILIAAALAAALPATASAAPRGPMVCIAPPADANAAITGPDAISLEFYVDEGDPLKSWSKPLTRIQSATDSGKTTNAYSVSGAPATGAIIVFTGAVPLTFTVLELKQTFETLGKNDEETSFMADAVPGVTCWSVSVATLAQ